MNQPAASVILATYNDTDVLEWTLATFARQVFRDFELILADDGSSEDYAPILKKWAACFAHGIAYVRHDRLGFRKTRIQNRAVFSSRGERLIFVDMDCLPREDFVEKHCRYLEAGVALTGRRVHIERGILPPAGEVYARGLRLGILNLAKHWLHGRTRVIEHGIELPIFFEGANNAILGSNLSILKPDFFAVNGFSEQFVGKGAEDTDLDIRIRRNGVRVRNLRNKLIQYHLMHEDRIWSKEEDREIIERSRQNSEWRTPLGLAQIREGDFTCVRYGR